MPAPLLAPPPNPSPAPRPAVADPADPTQVAAALLDYLPAEGLRYRAAPAPIPNGWETWTYGVELEANPALPELSGPLVLRVYASARGAARARREYALQQHLWQVGFPVPRPLRLECSCDLFGGPFLLLRRAEGPTLYDALLSRPWGVLTGAGRMARLHARLHRLPADQAPLAPRPFLSHRLEELRALIREHGLAGLRPGLDWLFLRRPAPAPQASILHLDWHPLNLVRGAGGGLTVLDWAEADVGDPHADVATALMILECLPHPGGRRLWEELSVPLGRWLTRDAYLRAYRRERPLDDERLLYFQAWAALRRLAVYGRWLCTGTAGAGARPDALGRLRPEHLRDLARYFERCTGVRVRPCGGVRAEG